MQNLTDNKILRKVNILNVLEVEDITEASYILRFERKGLDFKPGQHIVIGIPGWKEAREYSIFSGVQDDYLEILVREVENGSLSSLLRRIKPGDQVEVNGPFGFFMYNSLPLEYKKFIFIASGTGIAPFHSFVKSFPGSDYRIIHGIRKISESYGKEDYSPGKYITCTSGDTDGDFHGRLSSFLKHAEIDREVMIYFCGNNNMITEAMDILSMRGYSNSQMFTEVYF